MWPAGINSTDAFRAGNSPPRRLLDIAVVCSTFAWHVLCSISSTMIPRDGLTSAEAGRLLALHGSNALPDMPPTALWRRFLRQFRSPLIYLLLLALAFDVGVWIHEGAHGIPIEALAIAAILLLNAGLGTFQEHRSERALAQLRTLSAPQAWVMRDGKLVHLPSRELVPGDVVRLQSGERVPADGTLQESQGLLCDESILTGESVPVDKDDGERVLSGTLAVRGGGVFTVSKTGPGSTMGKLASSLGAVESGQTPLEKRLARLGNQVAIGVGVLAVLLAAAGLFTEGLSRFKEVVLFAVALAVAAVPEGLPAVVTLTLALGVQRMARRQAVVRRLSAVEALGSVTVIATDKTGTLTENKMRVHALVAPDEGSALRAMVLANEADETAGAGDPLELGLLAFARERGLDPKELRACHPRISGRAFDSRHKFMRATVKEEGASRSYLKGAPEVLLGRCALTKEEHDAASEQAAAAARAGYRVLALARAPGEAEDGLTLLGLVQIWDPPRAEVPEAIRTAQRAGVRVVMITGDHPETARAVAGTVGIRSERVLTGAEIEALPPAELDQRAAEVSVFARVSAEHKLRLVEALQRRGEIVAMTGDGVNDAPALKRADVGIAMGQRGSEVAREVADLVLLDDNFATIVSAIEEGRGIYENIQKFIRLLFSTNLALTLLVVLGAIGSYVLHLREASGLLLLPLSAIQLLWINFISDGPPALALALDRNPGVMSVPPRPPQSPLLDPASLRFVLSSGTVTALVGGSLLFFLMRLGYAVMEIRSVLFLYDSVVEVLFAYPARRLWQSPPRNLSLHAVIALSVTLQLLTALIPTLRTLLGLVPLDGRAFLIVLGSVALTLSIAELFNRWLARVRRKARDAAGSHQSAEAVL